MSDRAVREQHFIGGLLVGEYGLPSNDWDIEIADPDLNTVLDAVKIAFGWTGTWPVDVRDVHFALHAIGRPHPAAFLTWLMESFSERCDRAIRHITLTLLLRAAIETAEAEAVAETAVYAAVDRLAEARERSGAVHAVLKEAT